LTGAKLLISTGCCGGLVPGARSGLMVVPARILEAHGEQVSEVTPPDEQWSAFARRLAEKRGLHCTDRPIISVDRALLSEASKAGCHQATGAVAVDMESAALARVAGELGVPHLVLRHVMDAVDEPLPERAVSDETGRIRPLKLARAMTSPRGFLSRAQMAVRLRTNAAAVAPLVRIIVEEAI